MAFTIEAGTDLYGTKHNIIVSFNQAPTLHDFVQNVQAQFDVKARSCRPAGYPDVPFQVETLQIFGDTGSWVDLVSDHQLRPQSQVWVFQPESIWHSDAQGVIPKAEQTVQWAPRGGSPRSQSRAPQDTGCPPTLVEKMTAVFHEIDGQGKAYLLRGDVEQAIARAEIDFDPYRGGLFNQSQSGHITWDQWQQFAIKNPTVVDALFFRLKDAPQYQAPPPLAYVSRQQGYPGSPAPYHPQPAGYHQGGYAAPAAAPPPGYSGPSYGAPGGSPQRNNAMQEYEAARQRADQARLQKEAAEREERAAWDRLYKTP